MTAKELATLTIAATLSIYVIFKVGLALIESKVWWHQLLGSVLMLSPGWTLIYVLITKP